MSTSDWLFYFLIWCGIFTFVSFLMKIRIIQFILEEKTVVCALMSSSLIYQGNDKIWYSKTAHKVQSIRVGQDRSVYCGQLPETRNFRKSENPQVFCGIIPKYCAWTSLLPRVPPNTLAHCLISYLQRPGWFWALPQGQGSLWWSTVILGDWSEGSSTLSEK